MTHRSDWCYLGQHGACTSPFCRCDVCGCEKRETRSTKGETVLGSSGESWDTEATHKRAPAALLGSPQPGLYRSALEGVIG